MIKVELAGCSSRTTQPKRVGAFLDLILARMLESPAYVFADKELPQNFWLWLCVQGVSFVRWEAANPPKLRQFSFLALGS